MYIELKQGYVLTSDERSVILNKTFVPKSGENAGETNLKPVAYYSSIESALQGVLDRYTKMSDATTLKELLEEIKENKAYINSLIK